MDPKANDIWRDYQTDGVPASGAHKPEKADIRRWGSSLESIITTGALSDAIWKDTKANLDADLAHAADTIGVVYDDSTSANNGLFKKEGASGSGSWTQITTFLPGYQFITATDDGGSTANAWTMDTSPRLPSGDGVALVSLIVPVTNTSATVTVAFDGGTALAVKTASGNDPAVGGLVAGMALLGVVVGSEFRMRSDQASAAVQTAAENAQAYAEEWANKAEDSLVSSAAGGDGVDDYSALHWANKAATSKTAAEAAAALAAQRFVRVRVVDTTGADPATAYENGDVIDGVTLATGDLVLRATDGGDAADGVYVVPSSGAASRASQFDDYDDHPGSYFSVMEGTSGADTLWRCTSNQGGTLGTTALVMEEFQGGAGSEAVYIATDRSALKALDASVHTVAYLKENGREGAFIWRTGDYSAKVSADTQEGIYIKADAVAATSGAWVRENAEGPWNILWFGADNAPGNSTDHTPILNSAMATADTGQVIFFPAGGYKFFSKPDDIPKPLTLEGAAINVTFLVREYTESNTERGFLDFISTGPATEDGSGGPHHSIVRNLSIMAGGSTSGGSAIRLKSTSSGPLGYITLENLRLSTFQTDGWSHTLLIDGRDSTSGIRDVSLKNVLVFGSQAFNCRLWNVQAFSWHGGGWFSAGGSGTARLDLTGGGVAPKSGGPVLSISGSGDMAVAECDGLVFTGKVTGNLYNNSSAENCVVLGHVAGTVDPNWTNSTYYGP